jgi:hypothetical protein
MNGRYCPMHNFLQLIDPLLSHDHLLVCVHEMARNVWIRQHIHCIKHGQHGKSPIKPEQTSLMRLFAWFLCSVAYILTLCLIMLHSSLLNRKHRSSNYDTFIQLDDNIGKPQEEITDTVIPEETVFKETESAPDEKTSEFNRPASYV